MSISSFSHKIKEIVSKNKKLFQRYVLISFFSYAFVFGSLYMLVEIFKLDKSISFMIAYGINYVLLYAVQLRYLFDTEHDTAKFIRFCGSVLFFYGCANLFFNIGLFLELHYLIATIGTIAILMPFRFLVSKVFVFKKE